MDSTRVNILNTIAQTYYGINQDSLIKYANEAGVLAKHIGFTKGEATSLYQKGYYYLIKGDLESASNSANQSLSLEITTNNTNGIAKCYNLIGNISRFLEDYKKSILYYNKAIQLEKSLNNQDRVAAILSNIGAVYNTQGKFVEAEAVLKESIDIYNSLNEEDKIYNAISNLALVYTQQGRHTEALAYYQKCLEGYRDNGNKIFGAAILLNISLVYSSIDENDKALPYLLECYELNKEMGNQLSESKSLIGIGYVYRSKKQYNKALDYYNKALSICNTINSKEGLHNCYNSIGALYLEKEDFQLALENYKKALEVSLALGSKSGIAGSYTELGVIYYHLGDNQKAIDNLLKGKEIANELSLTVTQKEANLYLSKVYEKTNNYKDALERFKDYKTQSDSLFNKENIEKITQLEYDYKYKQALESANQRELKLTKTVKATSQDLEKSQRSLLLGVITFLVVALLLGSIIFYLKLKHAKSKTQNVIIEQKLLRSQMTPHFIFNSLSVLQGMILSKEEKKSVGYLSKFSKLLRITLENSREKTVLLSQELEAVNNYLALQNLEDNTYNYSVLVDDSIDASVIKIPPMLIQPFIENAIEHAFRDKKENKKIDVYLSCHDKKLICKITDNGVGINTDSNTINQNKKSLATTITSERLALLAKDFKTEGSIKIENRKKYNEQGTIVTLVIPYLTES
ncbi:tetratricopeptide repeat protein [Olleya sp. YS]|uniref:tetratricopeptide repeat-containing sensor histidine kinase n=1 Tax=Olleya sp. YS TaxID=3028318 RepID=UPI0024345185|nr:tetratricopeptide repeat protein [Olleya sp. YS]WGD34540.1 tetratricopeptide repeat protein [Olleya sp. YS]